MAGDLNWQLIALESEDGKVVYRMMMSQPSDVDCSVFTENVSVSWQFAEEGLPAGEIGEALSGFEGFLEALDDPSGNSFLTFVFSGRGKREWSYYAKDYNLFMSMLNEALASKPRFPIDIEHSHDPGWEYWSRVKAYVTESDA